VRTAHDCSDGGLAVALAECCLVNRDSQLGADMDLKGKFKDLSTRALLFGEAQGRVVVSTGKSQQLLEVANRYGVPATVIGNVSKTQTLSIATNDAHLTASLSDLDDDYFETIPRIMSQPAVAESS